MKKIIIGIVAVLAIAGGALVLTKNKGSDSKVDNNSTSANVTSDTVPENQTSTDRETVSDTITYGDNGFSPNALTIKSGATVTIKNDSSGVLQFDSNPHPDHTDNPELNVGSISPGKSQTFSVTKTGTFKYHNHLNASDTGTLTVE